MVPTSRTADIDRNEKSIFAGVSSDTMGYVCNKSRSFEKLSESAMGVSIIECLEPCSNLHTMCPR